MQTVTPTRFDIRVLYVEDDPDIREAIAENLFRRVRELHLAENGQAGLEAFVTQKPDLIITDIKMPVMDGLEMAERISRIDPAIPVIVTSAHEEKEYLRKAMELGIQAYIVKPINLQCIKQSVAFFHRMGQLIREVTLDAGFYKTLITPAWDAFYLLEDLDHFQAQSQFPVPFGDEHPAHWMARQARIDQRQAAPEENWLDRLLTDFSSVKMLSVCESQSLIFQPLEAQFVRLSNTDKVLVMVRFKS